MNTMLAALLFFFNGTPTPLAGGDVAATAPGWRGALRDGRRVGEWRKADAAGRTRVLHTHDDLGRRHGRQAYMGADGQTCASFDFVHGTGAEEIFDGRCRRIAAVSWLEGRRHGVAVGYDVAGRVVRLEPFVHGIKHGYAQSWRFAHGLPPLVETACFFVGARIWREKGGAPSPVPCALEGLAGAGLGLSAIYQRREKGFPVRWIQPGGPAEAAGVRRGDVLRAVDGEPVLGPGAEVVKAALTGAPGSRVRLRLGRGAEEREIELIRAIPDLKRTPLR